MGQCSAMTPEAAPSGRIERGLALACMVAGARHVKPEGSWFGLASLPQELTTK
jgi:hypothetical protein